jgi:hypothetical protein
MLTVGSMKDESLGAVQEEQILGLNSEHSRYETRLPVPFGSSHAI